MVEELNRLRQEAVSLTCDCDACREDLNEIRSEIRAIERTTPIPQNTLRGQANYYAHEMLTSRLREKGKEVPENLPDFDLLQYSNRDAARYTQALAQAFPFFRRHGSGRYSSKTLLRLSYAKDNLEDGITDDLPQILVAQNPSEYDELTEQKKGGIVGMAIFWPNLEGRTILAVNKNHREECIGGAILSTLRGLVSPSPNLWVGRANINGHRTVLSCGLYPTALSSTGAVRYGTPLDSDEEEGVDEDRNMRADTPRMYRPAPAVIPSWDPMPFEDDSVESDVFSDGPYQARPSRIREAALADTF